MFVSPIAKVIWRKGNGLKSHQTDWRKPGIEPVTPGLQGERFIHYTMVALHVYLIVGCMLYISLTGKGS